MKYFLILITFIITQSTFANNDYANNYYKLICAEKSTLDKNWTTKQALDFREGMHLLMRNPEGEFQKIINNLADNIKVSLEAKYYEDVLSMAIIMQQIQNAVKSGQIKEEQTAKVYQKIIYNRAYRQAYQQTFERAIQFCGTVEAIAPLIIENGCSDDSGNNLSTAASTTFCQNLKETKD